MTARRSRAAAAATALALLLAGCGGPLVEPTPPAAPGTPSAAPTASTGSPAPSGPDPSVSDEGVHVIAVGDVQASVSVPAAWSVEEGASDGVGEHRWLWMRNAEDVEMAVLSISTDGALGGA